MTARSQAVELEKLFMALADRTRLRLMDLMADGAVCVNHFAEALGESQPKISRHLAYLRNAGLVETRRNGKWIYYSILWPADEAAVSVLEATLSALAQDPSMRSGRARLNELAGSGKLDQEAYDRPIYEPPAPVRPVRNELDEFLL